MKYIILLTLVLLSAEGYDYQRAFENLDKAYRQQLEEERYRPYYDQYGNYIVPPAPPTIIIKIQNNNNSKCKTEKDEK